MGTSENRLGEAVLPSTHNLCFFCKIRKILYTPVNPIYFIKWGLRGLKLYRRVFVMEIQTTYDAQSRKMFVCVEVLRPSQPNGVMSSAVSLPNHTFTGQALSSKRLTSIVHILSPETDNCPS